MPTIRNKFHGLSNELNKISLFSGVTREILKDIDLAKIPKEELAEIIKKSIEDLGKVGDCIQTADEMITFMKPFIYEKLGETQRFLQKRKMAMFNKKILIVEDEEVVREIIAKYLRQKGFKNVLTAAKANEALEKIEKEKPDLILLDVQLEDSIDGVEILKRTKESLSPASMVVMISGHKDLYEEDCKKLGAIDFWSKPIFPNQLIAGIEKILAG